MARGRLTPPPGLLAIGALALLCSACKYDLSTIPAPDGGSIVILDGRPPDRRAGDWRPSDRRAPERRGLDIQAPDLRSPDLLTPDLLKPDLLKPDLLKPDLTPQPKSCNAIYGAAPSYQLCGEGPTSCRFYTKTALSTCDAMCKKYGGKCLGAQNNSWMGNCQPEPGSIGCFSGYDDQICECSRY